MKKLLGHRDYRLTLRYTEIALETVGKEHRTALTQLLGCRWRTGGFLAKPYCREGLLRALRGVLDSRK